MAKYLDENGLGILWNKIKTKVETGDTTNANATASVKNTVDGILSGDKTLVSPTITASWQTYKNDGTTTVGTANTNKNITVETGYKVKFTGSWKWVHNDTYKDPTSTDGNWGKTLPASNTSQDYTSGMLTGTTTIRQSISAPKAGLVYENGLIHAASGSSIDTKSDQATVTFGYGIFYGIATVGTITDALISGLTKEIVTGKNKQVNAGKTESNQMYVFAYPAAWGDLKAISKDGVDAVLTAFTKTTVNHDNGSGAAAVSYNVYYTGAGALNANCTLKFE